MMKIISLVCAFVLMFPVQAEPTCVVQPVADKNNHGQLSLLGLG